jgi:hypothetical protein
MLDAAALLEKHRAKGVLVYTNLLVYLSWEPSIGDGFSVRSAFPPAFFVAAAAL